MRTSQHHRCLPSCAAFLMKSFLLPVRNIHLFMANILLAVAYTAVIVLGYSAVVQPLYTEFFHHAEDLLFSNPLWSGHAELVGETWTRAGQLVAASSAYLLITVFTVGPVVSVVTVSAAVTVSSGEQRASFHAVLGKILAGSAGLKGPFHTALFSSALHVVACRGPILVFAFFMFLFLRYTRPVLLSVELLLFLLGKLFALYVEVVCTVAVVVSVAEPIGCFHGARALRQAWWILAEKTTPAVILVVVKGAVTAVVGTMISLPTIHYYHGMAYAILAGFVYVILHAALQVWFVWASTLYYYQCRQSKYGYDSI